MFSPFQSHLTFVSSSWYSGHFIKSCFFPRLSSGNFGEPNTNVEHTLRSLRIKHTLRSLRIWCCSVTTTLSKFQWLPFASIHIHLLSCFGFCLLPAVWEDFFSINFKRKLLFVFFLRPAPNHPILRLTHFFEPLLLFWFQQMFPYRMGTCLIHIPPPTGEAGKFDNFVQETFDINFSLTSPNSYDSRGNYSGDCSLCDPGVNFLADAHFHRTRVCIPCPAAARPFAKRKLLCHSITFLTFLCHWRILTVDVSC